MPMSQPKPDGAFIVVVIGDDLKLSRSVAEALVETGCRVIPLAANAAQHQLRQLRPNLLLLDLPPQTITVRLTPRQLDLQIPIIALSDQAWLEYEHSDILDFQPRAFNPQILRAHVARLRSLDQQSTPLVYPPLSPSDFTLFCDYLHLHSGLHFDERNRSLLERSLLRRMRAIAASDFLDYFDYLVAHRETRDELKRLISLLTVGETSFFRYFAHFEALISKVLPELIESNRLSRTLRIWSAGCSTGEEPYSLAILLLERFPELASWNITILATDINKRSLTKARKGVYRDRPLRLVEPQTLAKWFVRVPEGHQLDARVRDMVRFGYLNLQTDAYPAAENNTANCDIIFCRNVMIYFRPETTRTIVERFYAALRPGGYFFMGHAETMINISAAFRRHQHNGGFYYQKGKETAHPTARQPLATTAPSRSPLPRPLAKLSLSAHPALPEIPAKAPERCPIDLNPSALDELFSEASALFEKENYRTAYQRYDKVLELNPQHVGALLGQGFILANDGAYDEALERCVRILQRDDLCPQAYFLRGLILDHQEDFSGAVDAYRKALLLDISFVMPHYHLGRLYWRNHKLSDAGRQLKNVIRLLEKGTTGTIVPYSGGLSAAALCERCHTELLRLGKEPHFATRSPVQGRS